MTDSSELSAAKVVLLAVQLACRADISPLRYLVASRPKTLRRENLILRILLTFLPETLESSSYIPLLEDLISEDVYQAPKPTESLSLDQDISDEDARRRVRKLHLLPLVSRDAPTEFDLDPLTLFLLQRAYKVDSGAGLLPQILALIVPFINRSEYLRIWTIVTLLPLLRFSYDYYPEEVCLRTLQSMKFLDNAEGVRFLLSKAATAGKKGYQFVGRDLKGLIGPWMYGDEQIKRAKDGTATDMVGQTILPLDDTQSRGVNFKWLGWDEVFKWIMSQAESSWPLAVDAIEQWDGPGDVDLGGYEGHTVWLEEEDQRVLEIRYAQTALATAYLIRDESVEAQTGAHRILTRIISLLDYERIPTLPAAASLLPSILLANESGILRPENAKYLHSSFLEERNILTSPTKQATSLLYALIISAYLLTRAGCSCSIKRVAELALLQNEQEQKNELQRFMNAVDQVSKADDKHWIRIRNEILWLRDWTSEAEGPESELGNGIFGSIGKDYLEAEILKALLSNTRFDLARSIYEKSSEKPLPTEQVVDVVISRSKTAFNNASNGNKTRGGVKLSVTTLDAFPETMKNSVAAKRQASLVEVADQLAKYRIVLKHGQLFKPADISSHQDPLALIGILLDQNPGTHTQLNHMRKLGDTMIAAGLTAHNGNGHKALTSEQELLQKRLAATRVTSMCVDAALAVDDFETAYSYVMNNLIPAGTRLPAGTDDWSWRASLQAGKYHRNRNTTKPTHLGNANANLAIRHLEQRMDCLSQALRIAPTSVLQEILNAFRRCEEELEMHIQSEEDEQTAWDDQADELHGSPMKEAEAADEGPMSLFDLGRRSAENAKRSLASLRASQARTERLTRESSSSTAHGSLGANNRSPGATEEEAEGHGVSRSDTIRKRDQLRNAAVGTLASGIGWLINAPPVTEVERRDDD